MVKERAAAITKKILMTKIKTLSDNGSIRGLSENVKRFSHPTKLKLSLFVEHCNEHKLHPMDVSEELQA